GSRLDITNEVPGLSHMLCASRTVKLMQVVDAAGPDLSDVTAIALLLGHKSIRCMKSILDLWRKKLTDDEITLLMDFGKGVLVPDTEDPFPRILITPDLKA
ncbi:hypothetical protein M9458_056252, partial [Cirrhinus mrigala]